VTATDRKSQAASVPYRTVFGSESTALLNDVDIVITSPGIPDDNPLLSEARVRGLEITNPTQIFFDRCPCPIVGITGSSGKSTTTSLIAAVLSAVCHDVVLGGNIGIPMLDLLGQASPNSTAVLELSSFQLELLRSSPHLAVITNIAPNHLDRHRTMDRYVVAKSNIVAHQAATDFAVIGADDPILEDLACNAKGKVLRFSVTDRVVDGAYLSGDALVSVKGGVETEVMTESELAIPGAHNVANALAAVAASTALGVGVDDMRAGVMSFSGLPHRLQRLGVWNGIAFVDDSIATSPERARVGLAATSGRVVLIAGGRSKALPWAPLVEGMDEKVRAAVLIGEAAGEMETAIRAHPGPRVPLVRASSMVEAVRRASELALTGDTVLLAPGCTSYDMFADFEERGDTFRMAVQEAHGRGS
jgi:UDP-N-acetylmuramoylalanine--D-glutamate ligase